LDTGLARQLQLGFLADQPFQHLARQLRARRHGLPLLRQLLVEPDRPQAHLVVGDRLRIHYRHDVVRGARSAVGARRRPAGARLGYHAQALRGSRQGPREGDAGQPRGVEALVHGARKTGLTLIVIAEAAGDGNLFAQELIAGDILLERLQGVRSEPGKAHEFELEQDAFVRAGSTALQAFEDDPPKPAARVVLQARHRIDQAAVEQAEVQPSDTVPAALAFAATGTEVLALVAPEVVDGPLPAHVDLLALAALQPVSGADHPVISGVVARAYGFADRAAGL